MFLHFFLYFIFSLSLGLTAKLDARRDARKNILSIGFLCYYAEHFWRRSYVRVCVCMCAVVLLTYIVPKKMEFQSRWLYSLVW